MITTTSASHLIRKKKRVPVEIRRFEDGELYVRVLSTPAKIVLLAGLQPPVDNIIETLLLLDALKRVGTKVHLVITYFSYARQDRITKKGEALSAKVIANALKISGAERITIIDCHSERMRQFLDFENIIPVKPFLPYVDKKKLVIVAPDKGAIPRTKLWQQYLGVPIAVMHKYRPSPDKVAILGLKGVIKNRNVLLVDDMISTGGTIIEAAKYLKKKGANNITVAVTHGIFAGNALKKLEKAPIKNILVTNTLPQKRHKLLKVVSLGVMGKELGVRG